MATAVALGGDCLPIWPWSGLSLSLFGPVASDPTVSRLIATLAGDVEAATAAIRTARAGPVQRVWARRRPVAGGAVGQVIVDLDWMLVTAHSDKEGARRRSNAATASTRCSRSSTTTKPAPERLWVGSCALDRRRRYRSDHIRRSTLRSDQLPAGERGQVLVRADTGGASKAFLHHITDLGLEYSIGFPAHDPVIAAVQAIPRQAWRAAETVTATRETVPRSPS